MIILSQGQHSAARGVQAHTAATELGSSELSRLRSPRLGFCRHRSRTFLLQLPGYLPCTVSLAIDDPLFLGNHLTTVVNLQSGYDWNYWRLTVDVFNFLNTKANDITYF